MKIHEEKGHWNSLGLHSHSTKPSHSTALVPKVSRAGRAFKGNMPVSWDEKTQRRKDRICLPLRPLVAQDKMSHSSFITYSEFAKAMAAHSRTLAWKIPWTEEPGGLQSMGSLRIGPDWATSLSLFTFMHWRRKWQPTPVFLPGESQGRGSLVGCRLWGCTELDTTEVT